MQITFIFFRAENKRSKNLNSQELISELKNLKESKIYFLAEKFEYLEIDCRAEK